MAKREIRLQASILNNINVGTLDDRTWRLYIEILLMASMNKQNGLLQDTSTLAWYLRRDLEEFKKGMAVLVKSNLVKETTGGYMVENWGAFVGVDSGSTERVRRYRERQKNNGNGQPTNWPNIRELILVQDKFICGYCGDTANAVDHIVPINSGGGDDLSNLIASCTRCNSSKRDQDMEQWYSQQPFFSEEKLNAIKEILSSGTVRNGK